MPDRVGEASGEVDLRDFGAALASGAVFDVLLAGFEEGVAAGVLGGVDQRPAQIPGAVPG